MLSTEIAKSVSYIGAIDQGTTSTRFMIYEYTPSSTHSLRLISSAQLEHENFFPKSGWVEHDPKEIITNTFSCMESAIEQANFQLKSSIQLDCIGITNQRETICVWDSETGQILHRAIVWNDVRTEELVKKTTMEQCEGNRDALREYCGLPLSTYFSGLKLKWLLEHCQSVKEAFAKQTLRFGTIDTWLIWNLTNGKSYVTDVSNASRTMLMDIQQLEWSDVLCQKVLQRSKQELCFPQIKMSGEELGVVENGICKGVPITGCVGDQQSATLGQFCFQKGQVKNTYGTGCFMLMNTGTTPFQSKHGLLTTVLYQFQPNKPFYALEGSIAAAGSTIQWLKNNMGFISKASEVEALASQVKDTQGVYFVPAFSGLFAPRWRMDARGTIVGMTQYTTKAHIARAALEAVCFQTREVLDAMTKDSQVPVHVLKVDGGMSNNNLLMQIQSDILGITVKRPRDMETTARGAAIAAAIGKGLWKFDEEATDRDLMQDCKTFAPNIIEEDRKHRIDRWSLAAEKSMGWITEEEENE